MLFFALLVSLYATVAVATWGYTDNGDYWTIDTGASLVVEVSQTNGDIQSMKYNVSRTEQSNRLHMEGAPGGGGLHGMTASDKRMMGASRDTWQKSWEMQQGMFDADFHHAGRRVQRI